MSRQLLSRVILQSLESLRSPSRALPQYTTLPDALHRLHCLRLFSGPAAELASSSTKCWSCGSDGVVSSDFFCSSCGKIQPASPSEEYFGLFGMNSMNYDIDEDEIEQNYRNLQRKLHPDKFATASELEREYSAQQATTVNKAYDVLKNPLRRAHYMLQREGHGACEGLTITDPELLDYVMEVRGEIEEAEDAAQLQNLLNDANHRIDKCVAELKNAFRGADYDHAAEVTTHLRYLVRIKEAIIDKL